MTCAPGRWPASMPSVMISRRRPSNWRRDREGIHWRRLSFNLSSGQSGGGRVVESRPRLRHCLGFMEQADHLDELLTCRLEFGRKAVQPCAIVIFGASGDLTARKLIPAFYHLCREKQLPAPFRIIGFARRGTTDAAWRQELRPALEQFSRTRPVDEQVWQDFSQHISYCQ